ncbi:unnamed protein product, partial [Meganyctiphanes norvegica]
MDKIRPPHSPPETNNKDPRDLFGPGENTHRRRFLNFCLIFEILTLIPMLGPCFGILYSPPLLDMDASSTMTAAIFNVFAFLWNLQGLFGGALAQEFGWRKVSLLGVFLVSSGVTLSAFATSPTFLLLSFSIVAGIGGGLCSSVCFLIIPYYFDRRRGFANSFMMGGVCLGQIITPLFVQYLQDNYGFKGATMIVGAVLLNGLVGASLYQPVKWHLKPLKKKPTEESQNLLVQQSNTNLDTQELTNNVLVKRLRRNTECSYTSIGSLKNVPSKQELGASCMNLASTLPLDRSAQNLGSMISIKSPEPEKIKEDNLVLRILKQVVKNLLILRSPAALIMILGNTVTINGYLNFSMMVPFAMYKSGYNSHDAAFCLSIAATCNLFARMTVGCLSDRAWFNMKFCYMGGNFLVAFSMFAFTFLQSFESHVVILALFGCGVGSYMGLYNIIMVKYMGLEDLPKIFGAACLFVALGFLVTGPITGVIRDASGSYAVSIWFLSGMTISCFLLWLAMPWALKYQQNKQEMQQPNDHSLKA